jgi:hypothetical protein
MTAQARWRAGIQTVVQTRRRRRATFVVAIVALATLIAGTTGLSLAIFTSQHQSQAALGTKALFPGERVTPAFQVGDASSGSEVDSSDPFAFSGDGLTTTTSAWSTAFAPDRYVEFDLNNSLASGVAVSAATLDLRFASAGTGQACYYFDVRRISTGAVLGTYGGPGSPIGCVTGSTQTSFSTSIASVSTTSVANDLRIRLFGDESGGAGMTIDLATVGGSTAYQAFTLYPVTFRDAADTSPEIIPWGLALP